MLGYIISDKEDINVIEHEIQSFDVLHKTTNSNIFVVENNEVLYRNYIFYNAPGYGHVQVLEWFKRSGYQSNITSYSISSAAKNGHVHVLEWFKNSGYKLLFDEWAIFYASAYGHILVLEWFKRSGYAFKYRKNSIHSAKNIIVLKFFIENINPKKVIKWSIPSKHAYFKTLKFKTKKRYFKGYKKN